MFCMTWWLSALTLESKRLWFQFWNYWFVPLGLSFQTCNMKSSSAYLRWLLGGFSEIMHVKHWAYYVSYRTYSIRGKSYYQLTSSELLSMGPVKMNEGEGTSGALEPLWHAHGAPAMGSWWSVCLHLTHICLPLCSHHCHVWYGHAFSSAAPTLGRLSTIGCGELQVTHKVSFIKALYLPGLQ